MEQWLKNAIFDGELVDVGLRDGLIDTIVAAGTAEPGGEILSDASGYVMMPAFSDCHLHLDKTLLGMEWVVNDLPYTFAARVENERKMRKQIGLDPFLQASRFLERIIGFGTLQTRSHVDVDTEIGLKHVEGVLKARERYADLIGVELAAFPQSGLLSRPGTYELMDEALAMGMDLVGGIDPSFRDQDPVGSLNATFRLAEKHGKPIDIHLHEPGTLGVFAAHLIAERTKALGMQGKVSISHILCLMDTPRAIVDPMLAELAEAEIRFITCSDPYPVSQHTPRSITDMGVVICTGNDCVRDLWNHFGSGDMLERFLFLAIDHGYRRDADYEFLLNLGKNNAQLLGARNGEIMEGAPADFVLVKARNRCEAVVTHPADRMVYKAGRMIAKDTTILGTRLPPA